ncbi:MAG: hypothetical protein ACM3N4_02430 [Nitrososphaerota archaeon]
MQTLMTLLRSRVGIAISGVILIGTLGAFVGANSVLHPGATPTTGTVANTGSSAATATNGTQSATSGATNGGQGGNPSPTDTPASVPTNTPTGNTPVGQTIDLHGTIGEIHTADSYFMFNTTSGAVKVIVTNGTTQFQGGSTTFQGLRQGWSAEVKGQMQSDGTFLAFVVNSDNGN